MKIGGNSSGSFGPSTTTLSEINVTPLVDVMLVLLIVFMVTAPLMQQGVEVNLPKANAESLTDVPDQVTLVVKPDLKVYLNDKVLKKGTLGKRLRAISSVKPDVQVFIQSDAKVSYGFVAQVIAEVKQAKIHRIGLVTQPGGNTEI